jgi:branched-chain amino acid transport system ATP-binding protein
MAEQPILLEVHGLTKRFGGIVAVNAVDMEVRKHEIMGLIGPNGAGKSTLFGMVTGFLKPTLGSVHFQGRDITRLRTSQRGELGIICTFQKTALFSNVTVFEAMRIGQHRRTSAGVWDAIVGTARHRREERDTVARAREILDIVGLREVANLHAASLSYGQQRLVGLGIALAADPELLLLDEPAAGLNPTESEALVEMLFVIRGLGTTIVLVEHDMAVTMRSCDRITVLTTGTKIAEGTPAEIRDNEAVIDAYLGAALDVGA